MEKKYIEKEAVKGKLSPAINDPELIDFWEWQCSLIDEIPAADVREVVRGKWKKRKNWSRCVCSVCSYENGGETNFCPNCGADMRGK